MKSCMDQAWRGRFWLVAAGVACLCPGLAAAQTVTVDNGGAGFTILSGTWNTGSYGQPYNGDYNWSLTTSVGGAPGAAEWRPDLPHAGAYSVAVWYVQGANRAGDATFTVHHASGATPVVVNQQVNGETWYALGVFPFDAGTGGHVILDNGAGPSVVIADAVRFTGTGATADLVMAVSPPGGGSTSPAAGRTYTYTLNEVVPIAATPAAGYAFDHWTVSAGAPVADPAAPQTAVALDQDKTVTAVFVEDGSLDVEFRGFWADAFHQGFKSAAEIDAMINWALVGNYNAIIPEVLAFHDTGGSAHGAYWNSSIVPKAGDIVGGIDPLAYLVQQAHAAGLEVHCWLVAFRVSSTWPPSGNPTVAAHPEWLMVPSAAIGTLAKVGSYYTFDAGSPGVQDYLMSIVRELVTSYDIDGVHWDYIRYTQTDAGYPSDLNYAGSSLRRFQAHTGYVGVPPATGEPAWDDFRRRTITEVVRRTMQEVAAAPGARPLRHTAALVTWYPAHSDFHQTNPYRYFSDWEYWQSQGFLDATVPMCYFDENSYPSTYRAWVDNSVFWAFSHGRHTYIGPGIYMNTFEDSRTQILYARNAGAHGLCTYSYVSTNDGGEPWSSWYPYAAANFFPAPAAAPSMPWRDPALATEGAVYGRVTLGLTGVPLDNATVAVAGGPAVQTDGNGWYVLTRRPAGPEGTPLALSAAYPGYAAAVRPAVRVERAGWTEANFALGGWLPGDYDVDADVDFDDYTHFAPCLTGPDLGPPPAGCDLFDFDLDDDLDLDDLAVFQAAFTG